MAVAARVSLPLLRGTTEGAECVTCPFSVDGRPGRPVCSEHPEKPAWILIGEGPGSTEVNLNRPFCLVPETLVLMADLTWRPIGSIVVGDKILAVDEHAGTGWGASRSAARKWHVAEVLATHRRRAEVFRVRTDQGELHGSADHPVLVRRGGNRAFSQRATKPGWKDRGSGATSWLPIGKLMGPGKTGRSSRIMFLSKPWAKNTSYEAAWLAGFLDGEGHVNGSRPDLQRSRKTKKSKRDARVGFSQNAGATFERACAAVRAVGYELNAKEGRRACKRISIKGDLATAMRFLGEVRPERLVENFKIAVENKSVRGLEEAYVLSRELIGTGDLVDITTTTGTFIANGFVVHNCGPSGEIVNKILAKVGRPRNEIFVGNATLCQPPRNSPDHLRDIAAKACRPRLQRELAQWPGIPVLTFGAVAARALIPQETLDAIDPPTVPKSKKRSQKERQRAEAKALAKSAKQRVKAIEKLTKARLKALIVYRHNQLIEELTRPLPSEPFRKRKRPTKALLDRMLEEHRELPQLHGKATADAITEYELGAKERELQEAFAAANPPPPKPPKPKKVKITDIMGTCFDVAIDDTGPRPLIPTLHPAALLRGGGATIGGTHTPDLAFINMIYDAGKINALADGKNIRLNLNIETETTDADRAWLLLRSVLLEAIEEGEIAIDLETYVDDPERHHALMAYMARIRTIGLATSKRSVSLMWDLIAPWAGSALQLVLAHDKITKTFHNGIYDRTVLMGNGFSIDGPWEDTLLAHHAAFPGCAHRLQVVTSQFFATAPWKSEFRNAEETPEGLTLYNAKDTGATHALRPRLTVIVKQTKTEKIYELDKKMAEIASKMHLAGMPVSRQVNTQLLQTFTKNVAESRRAVEAVAENPKILENLRHHLAIQQAQKRRKNDVEDLEARYEQRLNEIKYDSKWKWKIGAGKHIAALLKALGVPLHQVTNTGQISTKKEILESLAHVPVVRDILTFRDNDKLLSTFIWQIFDRFDGAGNLIQYGYADDDDRIHSIWSVHKITGRWASSEPVVSNVPKDKWKNVDLKDVPVLDWKQVGAKQLWTAFDGSGIAWRKDDKGRVHKQTRPNLRTQIVAPEGRIFVGFDFGQLEARVIALISGDPFLCDVFARGMDIHRECARVVFPKFDTYAPDEQKKARDETKNFEYGAFYGGSPETLWKTLLKQGHNFKLVDVARAVSLLMNRMTGVVAWQRDCVVRASQPPYEIREFLYGRRRTFPLGQVEATEAMNFGVQAAGASIMNTGMARMDVVLARYKEAFAIAQIHDAAVFECWEDDAEKIAADVKAQFTQEYARDGRNIPFPVDVKIGKNWADV